MDRGNIIYLPYTNSGTLFNNGKEWTINPFKDMDESYMYMVK